MDREIAYAVSAGLDYWAFVIYGPDDPMTRGGIDLYLSSKRKRDIHFCAIMEGGRLGASANNWPQDQERLIKYLEDPSYQKVCGNRPLLFILQPADMVSPNGFASADTARAAISSLRKAAVGRGLGEPFIVAMAWSPQDARSAIDQFGLDAVSSYASNAGGKGAPYSDLVSYTEASWDNYARAARQVIPWVTTGWDRRPRLENPVFWEKPYGAGIYYERMQPAELTGHLSDAIRWNAAHSAQAKANAVIIYAWNEFDEGGWLCPTISEGDARLKAVRNALEKK
jgi:hypothetical protein